MEKKIITAVAVATLGASMGMAQEIATWEGDRKAAVSFTFDDGAPSHVSDGGPTFDKYGYKATFNLVVNWSPDWNGFQKMADNGHEIASHSNSHGQNMSGEEASSKSSISGKIKQKYGCITVAYPNCNVPNAGAVNQNYIAGRICNGSWQNVPDIMGKDGPSDWTKVPALMTGTENGIQGTNGFTGKMQDAVKQGGWVMFLTHGFQGKNNGSATYSPTNLSDIDGALQWAKQNDGDVWVAPFRNVAMYVKERKASKVNKKSGDASSITFEVTHSIKDAVSDYDYPLTVKIKNDNNWSKVKATQGGAEVEAKIANGNILVFAVPNAGDVVVSNGDGASTPATPASSASETPAAKSSDSNQQAQTPASSAGGNNQQQNPWGQGNNPWGQQTGDNNQQNPWGQNNPWGQQTGDNNQTGNNNQQAQNPPTGDNSQSNLDPQAISQSVAYNFAKVFTENGYIVVRDAQGMSIVVTNSLGKVVRNTRGLGSEQKVFSGAKGVYLVKVGGKTFKISL